MTYFRRLAGKATWLLSTVQPTSNTLVDSEAFFQYPVMGLGWVFFFFSNIHLFWQLQVLIVAHGVIVAGCRILVPWPEIKPGLPALGAWSLSHWTTREVPWGEFLANTLQKKSLDFLYESPGDLEKKKKNADSESLGLGGIRDSSFWTESQEMLLLLVLTADWVVRL